jgi:DNA-binding protein H-NS
MSFLSPLWHSATITNKGKSMATLKALQEKIAKLQVQAEAVAKKESSAVFGKIRDLMEKHGLTPDDIAAHFRKPFAGRKSAAATKSPTVGVAKYVDPKTGASWTGHGRAPAWIANAKNRDKFLASADKAPATATEKKPKAGNYVRGPQVPKYRDPMSGETWSGRGRAPAWLATAKDRTEYLIEKPRSTPAKSESIASERTTKKVVAKKATAKKIATKVAPAKKAPSATSAKKAAAKTFATAKKTATATKKISGKKTAVKRAPAKKVVAKKASLVESPSQVVESNMSNEVTSA